MAKDHCLCPLHRVDRRVFLDTKSQDRKVENKRMVFVQRLLVSLHVCDFLMCHDVFHLLSM